MTNMFAPCSSSLTVPSATGGRDEAPVVSGEVRSTGKHQDMTQLCLGGREFRAGTLLRRALSVFMSVVPFTECGKAEAVCDHQAEL